MICHQVNLHREFGGAEMYAATLAEALAQLGVATRLYVHPDAGFWARIVPPGVELVSVREDAQLVDALPAERAWVWTHGALDSTVTAHIAARHFVTALVHMPRYRRDSSGYRPYHRLYGVSDYVIAGLREAGLEQVHDAPLYGIANLQLRAGGASALEATSRYTWDMRKGRDRLLSWVWPVVTALSPRRQFMRRPGLTLGVVSRLAPIKQFPELFAALAPVLQRHPEVNLEIFGCGGYATVRDLSRVLRPLGSQVRWWGYQRDVEAAYRQLDFLLTGLPEKEALGLNVIEAQAAGTPVLAVDAPPFTETVVHGETGWLYPDPREDGAAGFAMLLDGLLKLQLPPLAPADATHQLARFTLPAFVARLQPVVAEARAGLAAGTV